MGLKCGGCISSREGPGPGSYGCRTILAELKGPVTFGRDGRFDGRKINQNKSCLDKPGPGAYEDKFQMVRKSSPYSVFG